MRVAMRQLLSRKSHSRLSDEETRSSRPGAFPPPSEFSGERVFPIPRLGDNGRDSSNGDILGSVMNVIDEGSEHGNRSLGHSTLPNSPGSGSGRSGTLSRDGSVSRVSGAKDNDESRKVSERTQFISAKFGPPRVITGSVADSTKSAYRRCEDEPIHTPGAVQSFGALIGLQYNEHGDLEVRIASENSRRVLGYGPEQLFALGSFLDVLKPEDCDEMIARMDHALSRVNDDHSETQLEVFQITLTFPYEPDMRLWCALHLAPDPKGVVICEFEEYHDAFLLKDADAARVLPVRRPGLTSGDVSPEDYQKSITSHSKPLAALEIARKKPNKEFSSLDVFNALKQAQSQISDCLSVQSLLDVVVGIINELTGFHRVMFYRFDPQHNGSVDAEFLNPKATSDVFRGLHYPASDIPKQARELYKKNRIRILHDRDAETARLVCRNESDFQRPLDLTHAYLRAMSPIHNKYLANMGVRSTMSISIMIDSDLWGLVACHGYGENGIRVSLPIRELCRSIGDCAALNIQRLLLQQRVQSRRLPIPNPSAKNSASIMSTSSTDLLKLVDADFALLSIDSKVRAIGRMEPYQEALAIMNYLQSCRFTSVRCSQNITLDFPGLSYPPGIKTLAGLLLIPLNVGEQNDFLVFFRRAQVKHVKWAGNPNAKSFKPGSEYLEPRTSFKRWVETIAGTSNEWTEDQLETASILALLYGRFVEAGRLKGSGTATQVSDNEDTGVQLEHETFNLQLTASRFLESLRKESQHRGFHMTVFLDKQLPSMVKGRGDQFKQLLVYFTSNAFKQSTNVKVNIDLLSLKEGISLVGVKIQDTGPGLSEGELDDTFQKFEQAQSEDDWPFPNEELKPHSTETTGTTNDDLTATAQYVRSLNGQIMVTSEVGKGTIFSVDLPFEQVPSTNGTSSKPKKFRNLFSPSSSTIKFSPPNPPPSFKPPPSPQPPASETSKRLLTPNRAVSPRPLTQPIERGSSLGSQDIDHGVTNLSVNNEIQSPRSETPRRDHDNLANLNILIADDDHANLKRMDEKLSQWGHSLDFAHDGQNCHDRFAANPSKVDVILMELKMPVVNGVLSTRMIRLDEREASAKQRVPIIAVSASLEEDKRYDYMQSGFDGWLQKPVDYRRLDLILQGVKNPNARRDSLYVPGQLKKGGWFFP